MAAYAVLDLGSNTVRLLIAEAEAHSPPPFRILYQNQEITRLGEGLSQERKIAEKAEKRTLDLLVRYQEVIARYAPLRLEVVGTAALREATNAKDLLRQIEEALGWRVRILSPEEEAYLTLLGVRSGPIPLPKLWMLLDIGGCSTELAQAEGVQMKRAISLPWGAVGIHEEFIPEDPPAPKSIKVLLASLRERLGPSLSPFLPLTNHLLVGTAGTITTLAAIHLGLKEYDAEGINGLSLTQIQIREIFDRLRQMPLGQRREVPGLEAPRADIILAGTAILLAVMEGLGRDRIVVSDGGLREGILVSLLGSGG